MSLTGKLVNSGINILRDTAVKHVNQQLAQRTSTLSGLAQRTSTLSGLPHNLRFSLNAKPKQTRKRRVGRTPRGGRRFSSGKSSSGSGEVINQGGQGGNVNLYFNGHPQGGNGSFYNPYQMSQSNALPLHNSLREYQNEGYAERDNRATELAENLGSSATQVVAGAVAEGVANVVRGGTFLGGLASGAGSTLSMLAVPLVGAGVVGAGSYLLTEEGRHNTKQLFGKVKTEGVKAFQAGKMKFSGSKVGSLFGSKKAETSEILTDEMRTTQQVATDKRIAEDTQLKEYLLAKLKEREAKETTGTDAKKVEGAGGIPSGSKRGRPPLPDITKQNVAELTAIYNTMKINTPAKSQDRKNLNENYKHNLKLLKEGDPKFTLEDAKRGIGYKKPATKTP